MCLKGSRRRSCSMMSWRTRWVALAVNAAIGRSGKASRKRLSKRYSGRKSWPHSEMQCASSMTKKEIGTRLSQSTVLSSATRSGESGTIQKCRRNAHLRELRDLILHQRDEGRDDHRCAALGKRRRQLVAERFASAGRHDHAGVATGSNAARDFFLTRKKGIVA